MRLTHQLLMLSIASIAFGRAVIPHFRALNLDAAHINQVSGT